MRPWFTRDGREIKLSEMTTSHIINCIAMLQRDYFTAWGVGSTIRSFETELDKRGVMTREMERQLPKSWYEHDGTKTAFNEMTMESILKILVWVKSYLQTYPSDYVHRMCVRAIERELKERGKR